MTAAELITELQKLPPELEVRYSDTYGWDEIISVELTKLDDFNIRMYGTTEMIILR